MKLLELFSGIGGFTLGLEQAGFKFDKVQFSEIDKYAISVYQHHFKEAEYVGSITDVHGKRGQADIITFGSPCQDFSIAGKRAGMGGERSSLISQAIRLITEIQPKFFIWENVKGTFSSNDGADFWAIIQEFANIGGYRLEWQLLNTSWFLPQNRERIYLVGSLGSGSGREVFPLRSESNTDSNLQGQQAKTNTLLQRYGNDAQGSFVIERELSTQKGLAWSKSHRTGKSDADKKRKNYGEIEQRIKEDEFNTLNTGDGCGTQSSQNYVLTQIGTVGEDSEATRVYDSDVIAKTIKDGGGMGVKTGLYRVSEPTKKGYAEAGEGDSINLQHMGSTTRKGRVGKGVAQTLDTACNQGVIPVNHPTIRAEHHNTADVHVIPKEGRIRRLTPLECERLQGFPDNWTAIGTGGEISDTQRYKMCGNAVSVPVVAAVGKRILDIH